MYEKDDKISIIDTMNTDSKLDHIRHSLAHLLAAAVLKEFPDAKLGIGPVIEHGFYYDFLLSRPLTPQDLKGFEKEMRRSIKAGLAITGESISKEEAEKRFMHQPFKLELIQEFATEAKELTAYKTGDIFEDLCKGGHVENTKEIDPEAFTLSSIAGAYWKGSEKNPQLQRIYGLAFQSKEDLAEHLRMLEEAKKRDHRKLGKELGLFMITDEVGPGLPLFYPKGAALRRVVENYISDLQESRGYEPIWIPHITKSRLYEISGHLQKYDALYPPMQLEGEDAYYLKPMNCPHFMMLYKSLPHSYKELPVRYVCTTTNYRYEKSGELSGLTRVRALTQDDCHVFATKDQIEGEINLMLDMIQELYKKFGFEDFWVRISVRDSKDMEKYIGDSVIWNDSEATLKKLVSARGWKHEIGEGEAAFYGPKLDFMFKDALGREWQLSTIQLDMNLPQRFDLEYISDTGAKERPVVIHRAILGSTERFLGILIEHFAGAFPFWLAPVQVAILSINEKHAPYIEKIKNTLRTKGVRIESDERNESIGKKIREAEMQKIPFVIVVGDKEAESETVALRARGQNDLGTMTLEAAIAHMLA